MIERVRGTLLATGAAHVVVEVGGVGLQLSASSSTIAALPRIGEEARLLAYLVVREDALQLYGFGSEAERELFLLLLGVQSVGPKLALAVLSSGDPGVVGAAIASGDAARLQAVPGVGKRTAERIVVELRDKIAPGLADLASGGGALGSAAASSDPRILARQALEGLGFAPGELDAMLSGVEADSVEELVSGALRKSRASA
ncbi:MAG: Holliday junction branch migration protein RuvA [Solirubrobacteraceae bacterium]|nr:Holliday junction branch migration protein RuvA [Solirubrobacteraceae bacterium]